MRWCSPVLELIAASGRGGYIVAFPSYRPDLVEELATALGCAHVDFRKECMAPLEMQAHTLDIAAIEECASERGNACGIVLHNAEALLAAKPSEIRKAFMTAFTSRPRDRIAVLPLAIFGADAAAHPHVIRLTSDTLPEETMLRQLASMRFQ